MLVPALIALAILVPQEVKTSPPSQEVRTIHSRSGEKQLEVEDAGDGTTWLVQRSSAGQAWTKTVTHSVVDAFVCEDGTVVAYGESGPKGKRTDTFVLTILRGEEVRLLELHPHLLSISHAGSYPAVTGLLVWETLGLCAFVIREFGRPDQLWTYALSNGSRKGVIEPEPTMAESVGEDPELVWFLGAVAPGANELLLVTFQRRAPVQGTPGPGNYVGQDRHGIVALFRADGTLLWSQSLPDGQFCGKIGVIESTAQELRFELDVNRYEPARGRQANTTILVEKLALRFHRDDGGAWLKE